VSDRTVFYGQFGKFTQQPPLQNLYTGWDNLANQVVAGNQVNLANPELKPTKTTSYEVGFRQQLGDNAAIDVAAFYKETRDLIVLESLNDARPVPYDRFTNGDFGTVKGFSLKFDLRRTNRLASNIAYTFQQAGGTGSAAGTTFFVGWLGGTRPTFVSPTDFDQRHSGSVNFDLQFLPSDGAILRDLNLNLLFTFGSGFPYTPRNVGDTVLGPGFATAFPRGAINSATGPWQSQLDLRLTKGFRIGAMDFDIFLWGVNILGTENWDTTAIFGATGSNSDNGYLDSPDGQNWIRENGGEPAANLYNLRQDVPGSWSVPRQWRLGLRFDL
jgi:hypothetical protein